MVSGVSGSGNYTVKAGIISGITKIKRRVYIDKAGLHKAITGDVDYISQIEMVDQN